ncbi:ComF family protein [Acanthopleuribacter pedis]|uniref:ComF family protein n=1 Tax=Acanthopleuribacter pedis TaxID=442870 RepID=A0A8J7QF28_9BACT|nr:ComF family protein [Acanthopleuribacter pedis]MBO1322849.1 ComF family protein [Acanthopleuribacter pedis]
MTLLDFDLTGILAPNDCLLCQTPQGAPLCSSCQVALECLSSGCRFCCNPHVSPSTHQCAWCERLAFQPQSLEAGLLLRNQTRKVFHLAKFQGYWPLIDFLCQRGLNRFLKLPFTTYDGLAYVPSSFFKRLHRPVNPAYAVANFLHRKTGIPLFHLLSHRLSRQTQIGLDYQARRRNAQNRFHVVTGAKLPRSLILVDDVLTTGATLTACSQQLHQAGVQRIAWFGLLRAV